MYALDTNGIGPNPQIQTQVFTVTGSISPIDPWFQNFSSDCKMWMSKSWPVGAPSYSYTMSAPDGCKDEYPANNPPAYKYWTFESTNETYSFVPVHDTQTTLYNFAPDRQVWNYGFYPKATGGYSIGWVTDKLNYTTTGMKKDTHSGMFFERELGPWATQLSSSNIFIEFDFKVNVSEQDLS